jgi:hypothetical protein
VPQRGTVRSRSRSRSRCRSRCRCPCPLPLPLPLILPLPPAAAADSVSPGLLVRLRRPSVVPSAWSLGWWIASALRAPRPTLARLRSEPSSLCDDGLTRSPAERGLKGCDHADGTPAAYPPAGRTRQRRAPRGSPAAPLCAACRVAGGSIRHNGVPGTPLWRAFRVFRAASGPEQGAVAVSVTGPERRRPTPSPGEPGRGALPEGARQRHCAQRAALPEGRSGTMACPARPVGSRIPRVSRGRM